MKIGFLVPRPTQFEAPFYRFAAGDRSHELEAVFTADEPGSAVFDPELGHEVSWGMELLQGYPQVSLPREQRRRKLDELLAARHYDLLITNGYTEPGYLRAARVARRIGTVAALRLDSVLPARPGGREAVKRLLFRLVLSRAYDLFLATGTLTRQYLAAMHVPDSRVGLLPYAIDVGHFRLQARLDATSRDAVRGRHGIPPEGRVLLAVSKLNAREAPWDLIRAVAGLDEAAPWLLVVGDGPARSELERQAARLNARRVVFAGYAPYGDLPSLYGAADAFVHVPREERWGVSVAEALAAGLPVVASSVVGAAHDLVAEGQNGFLCEPGDVAGLGRCVTAALALDRETVAKVTSRILQQWDYAAAWRGLLDAAAQARRLRAA